MLPPRGDILRLIDHFFANTGKLFPYLYKPAVLEALSKMTSDGFQRVERAQLCVLHLIMAFASTHGPSDMPIRTRMEQGDIFLQRALGLIPTIVLAVDNLESSMYLEPSIRALTKLKLICAPVQALVMATQYVQGTQRCAHTWELLGRLVHASLQVGIHRAYPVAKTEDRLKLEVRKRTWWMCFIMDKYVF